MINLVYEVLLTDAASTVLRTDSATVESPPFTGEALVTAYEIADPILNAWSERMLVPLLHEDERGCALMRILRSPDEPGLEDTDDLLDFTLR